MRAAGLGRLAAALLVLLPGSAPQAPARQRFTSRTRAFQLDLPADWRQLAPTEAAQLRQAHPDWPEELLATEPAWFYVVGPVDRWLRGEFDATYLHAVEQRNEWDTGGADLAAALQQQWAEFGRRQGVRYELADVQRRQAGTAGYDVIQCLRRRIAPIGPVIASLDTYLASGGRQLTLALCCREAELPRWEPEFRQLLATLSLAQKPQGTPTLGDRLWTPILTGAIVGLLLLGLYRWSRRRV